MQLILVSVIIKLVVAVEELFQALTALVAQVVAETVEIPMLELLILAQVAAGVHSSLVLLKVAVMADLAS